MRVHEFIVSTTFEKSLHDAMALPGEVTGELVRCGDCKHWYMDADVGMACMFTNLSQPEDGYCNWAVRAEE